MNFTEAKEIATIINGVSDQIVNISIIGTTATVAFSLKYWKIMRVASKASILLGVLLLAVSAVCAYVNKGFLITILIQTAEKSKLTVALDEVGSFAFFQFASLLLGLMMLAAGLFFCRDKLFETASETPLHSDARRTTLLALKPRPREQQ